MANTHTGNIFINGIASYTDAIEELFLTGAVFHVYGQLTIVNSGGFGITGIPTVLLKNRIAQYTPDESAGAVVANVKPFRLSQAHRARGRS